MFIALSIEMNQEWLSVTLPLSKVRESYRLGQPLSLALLRRTEVA
jgi:hypothetical protein